MPRENSFTDSEGRSLTPDLEEVDTTTPAPNEPAQQHPRFESNGHEHRFDLTSLTSGRSKRSLRSKLLSRKPSMPVVPDEHPRERFRKLVHKVISMHRGTTLLNSRTVGSEPGVDPSRPAVDATYRHITEDCEIEVIDYSAVRSNYRRLNNKDFVDLMQVEGQGREPWVKVRWINIGGVSWDIIKALSKTYGGFHWHALQKYIVIWVSSKAYIPWHWRTSSYRSHKIGRRQTTIPNTCSCTSSVMSWQTIQTALHLVLALERWQTPPAVTLPSPWRTSILPSRKNPSLMMRGPQSLGNWRDLDQTPYCPSLVSTSDLYPKINQHKRVDMCHRKKKTQYVQSWIWCIWFLFAFQLQGQQREHKKEAAIVAALKSVCPKYTLVCFADGTFRGRGWTWTYPPCFSFYWGTVRFLLHKFNLPASLMLCIFRYRYFHTTCPRLGVYRPHILPP